MSNKTLFVGLLQETIVSCMRINIFVFYVNYQYRTKTDSGGLVDFTKIWL